ncbi:hypothetical protein HDK64DRAFT_330845 [Phyllosticta capitalensis]
MPWDSRGPPVLLQTLSKDCRIMLHSASNPSAGHTTLEDSNEFSDAPLDFPVSTPATPRWSYASRDEYDGSQDHVIDYAGLFAHYVQDSTPEPAMDGTVDGSAKTPNHSRGASVDTTIFSSHERAQSNTSIPESHMTSGASSLSSMASRVARRAGPDMRLMNVSKSEWVNKFSNGRFRRGSGSDEDSRSTSATATQAELDTTTPPAAWPLPDTPLVMRMPSTEALASKRALKNSSDPHRTPSTEPPVPRRSSTTSGPEISALDESYSPRRGSTHSWDNTEGQETKTVSGRRPRPSFPRWKSHRSQRSKDKRSSGQSDPPLSPSLMSPPLSPNKVEEVTATAIKMEKVTPTRLYQQKSRRSLKRWLWPGPLTASDAQSIGEVIQPHEMQALNPTQGYPQGTDDVRPRALHSARLADALPHAKVLPLTGPESPTRLRRDRLLSPLNSSHPSAPAPTAGRGHGFVPPTPDLFTPFTRLDRREGTSYFGISEELSGTEARRSGYYSPDYIGSALGGLSPPESPEDTPEKEEPEKMPEFEYFARHGTARNSTFPAGFSPPEETTPNSPPSKRGGFVLGSSSPDAGTAHPASQFPALGAHPVRPPRVRRQPASSSSGLWDSDAILMSQPDMTTPDEVPGEAYSYSPSRSKTASTVTTTSLATANTTATGNTTATSATTATALSDSTVKPRQSTSSISSTTTALPRAAPAPASFHRPLSSHRNSTASSSSSKPASIAPPIPPATPVNSPLSSSSTTTTATAANTARRMRRESARSTTGSTHTTGTTGTSSTSRSAGSGGGPPKQRDWFRVRMDQIMADDVGGAAVGGIALLPPPQQQHAPNHHTPPLPPPPGRSTPRRSVGDDVDHDISISAPSNHVVLAHSNNGHTAAAAAGARLQAGAGPATVASSSFAGGNGNGSGISPGEALSTGNAGGVGTAAGAGAAEFVWDVPEHLPGSPLCPLSPKHRGGGRGICVYHGRRKTQRTAELML